MKPEDYCKLVDFIPVLQLQAKVDPKLEIYHAELNKSELKSKKKREMQRTEFFEIQETMKNVLDTRIKFGHPGDFDIAPVSQRELACDLSDHFGIDGIDLVFHKRGIVKGNHFDDLENFEHVNYFAVDQVSRGNPTNNFRKILKIPIHNPKDWILEALNKKKGLKEYARFLSNKFRSNQVSEKIYLDGNDGVSLTPQSCYDIAKDLADTWNKDVATASSLYSFHNRKDYQGKIYHLTKIGMDVVL